jgi:uncharacterized protein with beta-barrel porin domain
MFVRPAAPDQEMAFWGQAFGVWGRFASAYEQELSGTAIGAFDAA